MLITGIMGQNCMKFLPMCFNSIKESDKIIYIDGGSSDGSLEHAKKYGAEIINNEWNPDDKNMNGKQRNVFLKYSPCTQLANVPNAKL